MVSVEAVDFLFCILKAVSCRWCWASTSSCWGKQTVMAKLMWSFQYWLNGSHGSELCSEIEIAALWVSSQASPRIARQHDVILSGSARRFCHWLEIAIASSVSGASVDAICRQDYLSDSQLLHKFTMLNLQGSEFKFRDGALVEMNKELKCSSLAGVDFFLHFWNRKEKLFIKVISYTQTMGPLSQVRGLFVWMEVNCEVMKIDWLTERWTRGECKGYGEGRQWNASKEAHTKFI